MYNGKTNPSRRLDFKYNNCYDKDLVQDKRNVWSAVVDALLSFLACEG